jgi:hypothetical protein
MKSNICMKTEIFDKNLHVLLKTVIICRNVGDIILKNFNQVVDTLMKGFATGLQ